MTNDPTTSQINQPKRLITHSEEFHTDDVFATALLLHIFPDAEMVRSRDESVIATGFLPSVAAVKAR